MLTGCTKKPDPRPTGYFYGWTSMRIPLCLHWNISIGLIIFKWYQNGPTTIKQLYRSRKKYFEIKNMILPDELNNTSSMTLIKSSSGIHLQKAPRHPEAADREVSSVWETRFNNKGNTCLRIGALIFPPDGSRQPLRA